MINNKKILAIIPARGGSKGIYKKNITLLAGKPLISYTIDAALTSEYIDVTIVSTDDKDIFDVCNKFPGIKIIARPANLAQDDTPTEPVVMHVVQKELKEGHSYDIIILLQPTSPLRTGKDIDDALKAFSQSDATALISVFEPEHTPYKAFRENSDGYLVGLIDNKSPFMRRQDLPKTYMPNGAIYIINYANFTANGSFYTDKTIAHLMSSERSIDLDTDDQIYKTSMYLSNKTE